MNRQALALADKVDALSAVAMLSRILVLSDFTDSTEARGRYVRMLSLLRHSALPPLSQVTSRYLK